MANTFKSELYDGKAVAADTPGTVFTVPGGATAIVIGLMLTNVTTQDANPTQIDAKVWVDRSGTIVYIADEWPIPAGGSIEVIEGKMVLQAGDIIKVEADTANALDALLSYLEQT